MSPSELLELAREHLRAGRLAEAESVSQQLLRTIPGQPDAYQVLGIIANRQGNPQAAVELLRQALSSNPHVADYHISLGVALENLGRLEEAAGAYRQALALRPNFVEALNNLGGVFMAQGRLEEAAQACRQVLAIQPNYQVAVHNLSGVLMAQGRLTEACKTCQQALELDPNSPDALITLGNILTIQGRMDESVVAYRRALELKPDDLAAHDNLIFRGQYRPGVTLADLAVAHAEWDRRHAEPLKSAWKPFENDPDPERRLRLGFTSADFWRHPVGYFFIGLLEGLRSRNFETICYDNGAKVDDMTGRIAAAAGRWRDVRRLSHQALADRIRADRIDILFDLAGHTAGNRLPAFALKPAPIQITWLGYVGTTGLAAMDYLLADRFLVPEGVEEHYREKILRMPDGYVCFEPPGDAPEVSPLPASSQGHFTFGSFNNLAKITPEVVRTWSKILGQVPGSRLVLKFKGLDDEGTRRRFEELFEECDVDPARLDLMGWVVTGALEFYHRIDLALDPFPYTGSMTTCEALWMGVPVVTLTGETFAGRQSLSHLSNVGLTETIARDQKNYVKLAVELAEDLQRLAELRAGLRDRLSHSPLCDSKRFAENLMEILRSVWREWSKSSGQ